MIIRPIFGARNTTLNATAKHYGCMTAIQTLQGGDMLHLQVTRWPKI